MMSPLQMAYIGDAVYEVLVRAYILDSDLSVNELHNKATDYVRAEAQADLVHALEEDLSEKEISMVKKGRNTKGNSNPKNVDISDYRYATGFETLFGYLYIREEYDRIYELFEKIIRLDQANEEEKGKNED